MLRPNISCSLIDLPTNKCLAKTCKHSKINIISLPDLDCAFDCYEKGFYNNVVFLLHHAIEQACRGIIRLYTGYHFTTHNISRLLTFCNCFSHDPTILFKRYFEEEKRLFHLLANSYNKSIDTDHYPVIDHDADKLCTLVKAFLDLALQLSKKEPHKTSAKDTGWKGSGQDNFLTLPDCL